MRSVESLTNTSSSDCRKISKHALGFLLLFCCQDCFREWDILDSIDANQSSTNSIYQSTTATNCSMFPNNSVNNDDWLKTRFSPSETQGKLVGASDNFDLSIPTFLSLPFLSSSPSPELKYYKRRAFWMLFGFLARCSCSSLPVSLSMTKQAFGV